LECAGRTAGTAQGLADRRLARTSKSKQPYGYRGIGMKEI
jgi:hypothetical protein